MAALCLVTTFLVHGNTITGAFLSDDTRIVSAVRADGPLARWTGPPDVFFRPLVSLLFAADHALYDLDPRGYHVTNLLLHALVAFGVLVLGVQLARRAMLPRPRWLGGLAGALFLVHPSHSESVAWIAGRSDLLASVFALGSIVLYLAWRWDDHPRPRMRWLSLGSLVAALLSKEAAITVPAVLIALDLLIGRESLSPWANLTAALGRARWHLAILPVYLVSRALIIGQVLGGYGEDAHVRLDLERIARNVIGALARATVPRIDGQQVGDAVFVALVGAVVVGLIAAHRQPLRAHLRRWPPWPGGLGLTLGCLAGFMISYLPALGMPISRISSANERTVYLPSAFVAVMLAALVVVIVRAPRLRLLIAATLIATLGLATVKANGSWRDAARASDAVLDAILATEAAGSVYVLSVPASIDGAYVLHNNLRTALRLRESRRRIGIVAPLRLRLPAFETPIRARRIGAQRFLVTFRGRGIHPKLHAHPLMQVEQVRRNRLEITLPRMGRADWVLAWTGGGMEVIKEGRRVGETTTAAPGS